MKSDDLVQWPIAQAIATLNDIVSQLVCGLATEETPTKGWAYTAVATLAESSESLGFELEITPDQIESWKGDE